jgi:hypothetical protein
MNHMSKSRYHIVVELTENYMDGVVGDTRWIPWDVPVDVGVMFTPVEKVISCTEYTVSKCPYCGSEVEGVI